VAVLFRRRGERAEDRPNPPGPPWVPLDDSSHPGNLTLLERLVGAFQAFRERSQHYIDRLVQVLIIFKYAFAKFKRTPSEIASQFPHIMLRDELTQKCSHFYKVTDFGYPSFGRSAYQLFSKCNLNS
jgi:hypothetical protein